MTKTIKIDLTPDEAEIVTSAMEEYSAQSGRWLDATKSMPNLQQDREDVIGTIHDAESVKKKIERSTRGAK